MAAPTGNQFWKARSRHGPNVTFSDPEALRQACLEYFQWCEANPLKEDTVGFFKGSAVHTEVNKMRAMTSSGLAIFLGITHKTLIQWKNERDDLADVLAWAEDIIRNQKFLGAAAGLLNANIISRDLGLKDSQSVEYTVPQMIIQPPDGPAPPMPPIFGEDAE